MMYNFHDKETKWLLETHVFEPSTAMLPAVVSIFFREIMMCKEETMKELSSSFQELMIMDSILSLVEIEPSYERPQKKSLKDHLQAENGTRSEEVLSISKVNASPWPTLHPHWQRPFRGKDLLLLFKSSVPFKTSLFAFLSHWSVKRCCGLLR